MNGCRFFKFKNRVTVSPLRHWFVRILDTEPNDMVRDVWPIVVICWSGRLISVSSSPAFRHFACLAFYFTHAAVAYIPRYTVRRPVCHPALCGRQRVNLWKWQDGSLNGNTSQLWRLNAIPTANHRAHETSSCPPCVVNHCLHQLHADVAMGPYMIFLDPTRPDHNCIMYQFTEML